MKTIIVASITLVIGLLGGWFAAGWAYKSAYPSVGDAIAYDTIRAYGLLYGKDGGLAEPSETQSRILQSFPSDLTSSVGSYSDMNAVNRQTLDKIASQIEPGKSPLVRAKVGDIAIECIRLGAGDIKKVDDCQIKAYTAYQAASQKEMAARAPKPRPSSG